MTPAARLLASLLPALALALPLPATARTEVPAIEAAARSLLESSVPDATGPGMAVLLARGDTVLFRGARGMASIELGVPLSPDHVFRIGSVTKQVAAAGLLKLVDEGKVALDDPLSKYLPDFPNGGAITVAQLLNHTSGIKSYTGIAGYMDQEIRRDLDTGALIAVFADHPVDFAPGEGWNYNNSGYVLVGAVIEKASGMAWDRWLERSLFRPLAMERTRSGATRAVIAGHASGYSAGGDGGHTVAAPLSMTQPHAAGALVSTVDDLWRWNRALHGGQVLSAPTYARMIAPEGKAAEPPQRYGYGIQAGTVRGRPVLEHGGGINGFISLLMYVPEGDITVAVLRNADASGGQAVGVLARRLAALALGDPYPALTPVPVPEDELKSLEGVYRLDADNARVLRFKDGALTSQRSGGMAFPLIPVGDDSFAFADSLSRLSIERDAEGRPTAMRFFADGEGEGELWPRTDEPVEARTGIELPRAALERLVGDYAGEELAFKVFFDEADTLRVQVPGQPAFELKAESPSRLFITEVDAAFEFAPATGEVETATLVQGSARIEARRKAD
ncbi:MAG: serine hydrolase domain-containing protein [Pseudoxanthomonas sp.]|nr:serine hydrolase domain-containing protein [Pseudoxanthomonas sp.]